MKLQNNANIKLNYGSYGFYNSRKFHRFWYRDHSFSDNSCALVKWKSTCKQPEIPSLNFKPITVEFLHQEGLYTPTDRGYNNL